MELVVVMETFCNKLFNMLLGKILGQNWVEHHVIEKM